MEGGASEYFRFGDLTLPGRVYIWRRIPPSRLWSLPADFGGGGGAQQLSGFARVVSECAVRPFSYRGGATVSDLLPQCVRLIRSAARIPNKFFPLICAAVGLTLGGNTREITARPCLHFKPIHSFFLRVYDRKALYPVHHPPQKRELQWFGFWGGAERVPTQPRTIRLKILCPQYAPHSIFKRIVPRLVGTPFSKTKPRKLTFLGCRDRGAFLSSYSEEKRMDWLKNEAGSWQ